IPERLEVQAVRRFQGYCQGRTSHASPAMSVWGWKLPSTWKLESGLRRAACQQTVSPNAYVPHQIQGCHNALRVYRLGMYSRNLKYLTSWHQYAQYARPASLFRVASTASSRR